jgi:peptidoglycan/LPS O-acetylase OafA/YrhL
MVVDRRYETRDPKTGATCAQLPALTSLRGIAAVWVVLYHYTVLYLPHLDAAPHSQLIDKGYLAVDMFFMLSGFVMAHVYSAAFCESIRRHYRSFLVARIARLYPLHLFVLLLFLVTALTSRLIAGMQTGSFEGLPLTGPRSLGALIANIFMLQGLDAGTLSWNYPAWSISVEFIAYLAFPLALPAMWRAANSVKLALAICLFAALAWLAYLTRDNFDQWNGPMVLLRGLPEFLIGTLLYFIFRGSAHVTWPGRDIFAFGLVAAVLLSLHFGVSDSLTVLLFAMLIPIAVINRGSFARVASLGPLLWLGEISYSLYLVHGFVEFAGTKLLNAFGAPKPADLSIGSSLALMVAMLAACLLCAAATYSGIEVVWRRHLRNMLAARPRAASDRTPPASPLYAPARVRALRARRGISTQ